MTIIHPVSAITVARLAARVLDAGEWSDPNRARAREIVAAMERAATFGPAIDSPSARVLDAHARRLSALACAAYEADGLVQDRDLSWLWAPENMDAIHRDAHVY